MTNTRRRATSPDRVQVTEFTQTYHTHNNHLTNNVDLCRLRFPMRWRTQPNMTTSNKCKKNLNVQCTAVSNVGYFFRPCMPGHHTSKSSGRAMYVAEGIIPNPSRNKGTNLKTETMQTSEPGHGLLPGLGKPGGIELPWGIEWPSGMKQRLRIE